MHEEHFRKMLDYLAMGDRIDDDGLHWTVMVGVKGTKQILAEAKVLGRDKEIDLLGVALSKMKQELKIEEKRRQDAQEEVEEADERASKIDYECGHLNNKVEYLSGQIKRLNDMLSEDGKLLYAKQAVIEDAGFILEEALTKSGKRVRQRFQPVRDILSTSDIIEDASTVGIDEQ